MKYLQPSLHFLKVLFRLKKKKKSQNNNKAKIHEFQ